MPKSLFVFLLFLFLAISQASLEAKLLIMTHAYQRPDFIALQEKTFRAFLKDDYRFVVFNDATDKRLYQAIQKVCLDLNLECIPIPQEIHLRPYLPRARGEIYTCACVKCANVVQYSLDLLGFDHEGLVMIIDSDMFLVSELDIAQYMQGYDIAGLSQTRGAVNYLWNGILFFNMETLPAKRELSFNCGNIEGEPCDVGGYTYYYFRNHPEARIKLIDHHVFVQNHMHEERSALHPFLRLMIAENVPNSEFFMGYKLFHYRGGGNWDRKTHEYHRHKTAALHKLIDFSLQETK
jgi:hypothetical protein